VSFIDGIGRSSWSGSMTWFLLFLGDRGLDDQIALHSR
jgi:hypothetical protein